MASVDPKNVRRIASLAQRVLIIDPQPQSARLLSELLRDHVQSQTWTAPTMAKALAVVDNLNPQIIFVEMSAPEIDGCAFTRTLRRSHMRTRQVPVIMMTATATAAGILAARDAGVHEFLRKPFTTKDVLLRLEAVTLKPRDWVEAVAYVGPDRRRFNSAEYSGARKRQADQEAPTDASRMIQALRILKAAIGALDRDPQQAMRAMKVQTDELQRIAAASKDVNLAKAVALLTSYLTAAGQRLDYAALARSAGPLLAMLPSDAPRGVEAA
jgi:CheY-like chemotaxis protein